jgi:HSP20 family protein
MNFRLDRKSFSSPKVLVLSAAAIVVGVVFSVPWLGGIFQAEEAAADQLLHGSKPQAASSAPADGDFDTLFGDMRDMQAQMNRLFRQSFQQFPEVSGLDGMSSGLGDVDIRDDGSAYVVTLDLPGVDKSKIDLSVEGNDTLRLSAVRTEQVETKDEHFFRRERRLGQVMREIELPGPVKKTDIKAKYENGVLTVTAQKDQTAAPSSRKITIE